MLYDHFMDTRFLPHNTHLEEPKRFEELDPQLRLLKKQAYIYQPEILNKLPIGKPGIYNLGGGRQIGKTTLLKQWMLKLLKNGVTPNSIAFLTGELIDNHHTLLHLLQFQLSNMPTEGIKYIIIDEITYIQDWDKTIKYAADAGLLDNVELILTGSDLLLMQEARKRFPGRRGKEPIVNFHLYPLSFREFFLLKHPKKTSPEINELFQEWNHYLMHGGYLTAINDLALHGRILESTLITYSDWIAGDILKRGKQEHYLREILNAIIKRYGSQVSWNALAKDLSIDHPKTVCDYVALLESMDAVFVQAALIEDKLMAAPKTARKLMFTDPFIFHAIRAWLHPIKNPFENQIKKIFSDLTLCSHLVEATAVTHYRRFYPTYYIKAEGEVDIAYIDQHRFWPVDVKWSNQLHSKDLKQILKYPNSLILTKSDKPGKIENIQTQPLPVVMWKLEGDSSLQPAAG